MKLVAGAFAVAALLSPLASPAAAQSKTITGETKTVVATVEAIESASRTLTLRMPDGSTSNTVVPAGITRFPEIKIGDRLTTRYYENLVIRLKKPGEKDVNTLTGAVTPATGAASGPSGTIAKQRTITATITAIDHSVPSITFSGPNNWNYSTKVRDKGALTSVIVGDKVDITWTDALLVEFDKPAQKK